MNDVLRPVHLEEFVFEGALEVVVFHLVETIHVQLPNEAVHFLVAEVVGQDDFLELEDVLDDELGAAAGPVYDLLVLFDLHDSRHTPSI